ncbi:amino acid adenylation domain-containing protein [Streptomyces sp. NBC_00536]|uniref:amino acid adenylation domain-containing protein n=1 Tax=Streptomyces sp. NBC_00536 TaxID=2975769 RepID=UPI002E8039A2|nr:amino acid adenylation domain-containing protein [Streptomyces sp. NBC_00536]WUC82041.1 amino acid adenylation domain-containing protein [Streptomyces sp. NBC_00536]
MNTPSSRADRIAALPDRLRESLAQRLSGRAQAAAAAAAGPLIPAAPRGDGLPLSFGQQRLWFLEDFDPGRADYHSALPLRISGALDADALRAAVGDLVARHEALRTTFRAEDGKARQVVHDVLDTGWTATEADGEESAREIVRAEMARPYDLAGGPLVRVLLVRLAADAHVCVLGMHHIVTDGWSMGIVARELGELYTARVQGRTAALADVPVQYPDFAVWQRGRLEDGGLLERQTDWWREQLKGIAPLELPTDRPRPAVRSSAGAVHAFSLPEHTLGALQELARARGASLFMVLTAAVKAVLARWSDQEDIALGTSSAARGHQELEQLVGFLVNTVVLRTQVEPQLSFAELLGRVKDTVLDAFAHEDVPFDKLVEAVQPERDPSRTALVQAMVVLQNAPADALVLPGARTTAYPLERDASLFDLTFEFEERGGRLEGLIEYSTELFDQSTIARLTGHLEVLLGGALADPDTAVGALPLLTDAEHHQVVTDWNATELAQVAPELIHERLAAQAARTPDAVAVIAEDATLTHRELDERANRLAHHLSALGAGPGSLVGLGVARGSAMAVGLLAILKAGAAYVPLDPAFPADRLGYMLADSGARLVVTESAVRDRLPGSGARLVDLDADREAIAARPATAPRTTVTADDLAYVIYTSGSTGNPKGVAIEHRNVRHICASWAERYRLEDLRLRFLSVSSLSVDLFFADLIRSLPFGGALIIASKDVTTEPPALLDLIAETGATGLEIVPSLLNAVLQEVERRGDGFPPLRLISVGSEAWRVEDCATLLRQIRHDAVVVNAYGGTEATVDSTVFVPTADTLRSTVYVPIGRPLPDTRVYVLDARRAPVPVGVPGEIWIGGAGIGRGYHGRPDLTAERFVDSPFVAGDRLYRTGDRARLLPGGDLEFLGRADDQVKIRGFRIELGEVESALLTHPEVTDAVVLARQEDSGRRRLVAYVVPAAPGAREALDTPALRGHLSGLLPDYMVPAVFVTLDRLPLTPNGKVDRRSLPEPEAQAGRTGTEYAAPRDEAERILADVWADVLGVARVGIHDNFFDLGGDSILSIQVVSRARQAGLRLTSKLLFLHQNIAALAGAAVAAAPATAAAPAEVTGRAELTPIQRWFLAEHTVNPDHYAMSVQIELAPDTDPALLERALDAVVTHHDALRMRYTREGAEWIQEYGDRPTGILSVLDLDLDFDGDVDDAEQPLNDAALAAQRALDLATGALVRGVLFRLGADRLPRLFLAVHHIVMDGVSWRVLLEDLATAYDQLSGGAAVDLGAKSSSYQQWSRRLADHVQSGGLDHEYAHWRAVDPAGAPALPADRPDGSNITAHERTVEVRLGREETEALLQRVPSAYRTQINDVLVSALGRTLAAWTGSDRLVLGLEGHGREELFDDLDLSRTVGWYTTHFPVALNLPASRAWGETLKSVKEQLRAVPGRGLGYDALRFLSAPGTPGHALHADPLPQISFNYLGQWDGTTSQDGLIQGRLPALGLDHELDEPRPYLLDVVGMVESGTLGFTWIFSGEVFDPSTVEGVAQEFLTALRALIAHCLLPDSGGATPSDFPLAALTQADVDRIAGPGSAAQDIEDIYPLTPMQAGMLFHTLAEPGSGAYFEQMSFTLDGVRDPALLERAWQHVSDHLEILRGAVEWERVDRPLLVIHRRTELPVVHLDWRELSADEQTRALERHLAEDRARGIDLSAAPLMRLALVRISDTSVRVARTSHHVLLDGWSTFQMLDELTTAYRALAAGEQPALPARRPFSAYVDWLERQDLGEAEAYWRELLGDVTEPTALPFDRRPAATHRAQSAQRLVTWLSAEASERLYAFARDNRLTVNAVLQGAWALLLSRYSGERDVVFGATVSGRPADLAGVDSMVGMLINTLPVRVEVDADAPVGEWLARVQQAQVEARQFEYVPLPQIQGWSGTPRGTNLFESLVAFENFPMDGGGGSGSGDGVRLHGLEGADVTNFPLNLIAYAGAELAFALAYDPELFDADTIARLAAHLEALLTGMAAEPGQALAAVPMLAAGEFDRVVREWNASGGVAAPAGTVHGFVADRAALSPDAVAVSFGDESLTYRELEERANRLASHLVGLGAGPDRLVALSVERGIQMVVGLLGIMKSGAAYVPLDPAYPADRLAYMLADSGAELLVTHRGLNRQLPVGDVVVVDLDTDADAIAARPATVPATGVTGSHLAYVIYTSGSTGRPKGVAVEHQTVLNLLANCEGLFGFGPGDVWSVFHSYAFDFSVWELWGALITGGRAVVVPQDTARSPELMWELLRSEQVTVFSQTPSMFRELVGSSGELLPDLRWVVFGGEALEPKHVQGWFERFDGSGARLVNMYGITETTVHVTYQEITAAHVAAGGRLPAGRPLPSYRVLLLDERGAPVPVGVAGEIHVAGGGLARGYLHRPELTQERFPLNPFGEPGERMYRSGDVARWTADGTLEYLGRADDQVKIRGFRIELGEIETVLVSHPAIREAVVTAHQGADGHKRLVAYLVPDTAVPTAELRAHLGETLPDYMVPALFVTLDRLPLTPSGKVNRRALPAPEVQAEQLGTEYTAPRDETERILADVWAEVLDVEKVGVHDNFFDLGGDSILTIQVVSRARQALGTSLSPRLLFEAPTVALLAAGLAPGNAAPAVPDTGIPVAPRDGLLPMSFGQQRLWFLEDFNEGSTEYHSAAALRLTGPLDASALRAAVGDLVARHESLRTTFDVVAGQGVQIVHPVLEPQWHTAEAQTEERLRELAQAELVRPYDLKNGPLVRVLLVRLAADAHVCVLGMHHIVTDGWSMGVAARELGELYTARTEGRPAALADVPVQYPDFAAWQRERLVDGGLLEEQLGWWRERLAGIEPLELPTDRPRPVVRSSAGAVHGFEVPAATLAGLKELAREQGATLYMALTAAVKTVFARWSGQQDIAVGTASAGRGGQGNANGELEQLIGFLVNTVVLRSHIEPDMPFRAVLDQVKETVLDAFAHEEVPFERLVETLQPERDTSRTPLIQAMVVLQNAPGMQPALGAVEVTDYRLERDTALFDLTLEFEEHEGGLRALVEYSAELFDEATVARFGEHLNVLLGGIAADPDRAVADLPLLTAGEFDRVVREWNASGGVAAPAGTVHGFVADRAALSPDAVSVSFGDESLTYRELEERANRLASHLVGLGAGPDRLVALSVERGIQMVVGLLGIMKSGAAYVPLDPAYPADRLAYMLADSGAELLVTHRGLNAQLAAGETRVVDLDADAEAIAARPGTPPVTSVTGTDLAYVIYTSGSTGRPKGVAVEHRTVLNLLANCEGLFGFGPGDVWSVFHSYAFDFSVWELWGALITGGRAVVVPQDTARSPELMWELLRAERVTVFSQTPSMFRELVGSSGELLPDLRWVVFGGEALEPKHVQGWFERFDGSGARLVNMYGITETTVHVTYQEITAAHVVAGGRLPAGRPLPSYRVLLLDERGAPVPVGVAGEIHVAGGGLARGYLHRPELTQERFPLNPFGEPGERMYRSGDVARWTADGTLEYLGRADDQVKIRGFRIELGEIETVLVSHPAIREAVVTAHQGADGHKRLVAYLVADGAPTTGELRAHLGGSLPDYMVPAVFVTLDRLPLTPSGKVNRRALPAPEVQAEQLGTEYIAPRDDTEDALATVWAEVLGVEKVGVHDNFFDLGGDSILSIQLISRARQAGLRLTSKLLFVHQTVAELAAVVQPAAPAADALAAPSAEPAEVAGAVELTPIQRWFFDGHTVDPRHYAMSVHVGLAPGTDPALLAGALEAVVAQHDALRMRFTRDASGAWIQQYGEAVPDVLAVRDIAAGGEVEQALNDAALEAQRAIDPATGALVKGVFLRLPADPAPRLFLAVHHLVMDGVSWRVVLEDLATAYEQLAAGRTAVDLGAKSSSYQQWARRLADHVREGGFDHEAAYWRKAAASGAGHDPRAAVYGEVAVETVRLGRAETEALLQKAPAVFRTRINDVLLAALGRVLGDWAGEPVTIALEGHGREELFEDLDLSRTVGWFTTIYPVTLDVPAGDWAPALKAVRKGLRKLPGRGIGYGALRHLSAPGSEAHTALAGTPYPRISFNYLGQWDGGAGGTGLVRDRFEGLGADQAPGQPRPHLIDIVAAVSDGELRVDWMHAPAVHSPDTVRALADAFRTALRQIAAVAGN